VEVVEAKNPMEVELKRTDCKECRTKGQKWETAEKWAVRRRTPSLCRIWFRWRVLRGSRLWRVESKEYSQLKREAMLTGTTKNTRYHEEWILSKTLTFEINFITIIVLIQFQKPQSKTV